MTVGKGVCALALFSASIPWAGFGPLRPWDLLILGLSGVLGIAVGDTLFFVSLTRLGPRDGLFLTALIPVAVAVGAWLWFGEALGAREIAGGLLCVVGVGMVLREAPGGRRSDATAWRGGIVAGLLSVVACAIAVLFAKAGLTTAKALDASLIRTLTGTAGAFTLLALRGRTRDLLPMLHDLRILRTLVVASFIGTYLGVWLSNAALRHTNGAMATVLNSTSSLFVLLFTAGLGGRGISLQAGGGGLVAISGIGLLIV